MIMLKQIQILTYDLFKVIAHYPLEHQLFNRYDIKYLLINVIGMSNSILMSQCLIYIERLKPLSQGTFVRICKVQYFTLSRTNNFVVINLFPQRTKKKLKKISILSIVNYMMF